jgi:hypothetical protein
MKTQAVTVTKMDRAPTLKVCGMAALPVLAGNCRERANGRLPSHGGFAPRQRDHVVYCAAQVTPHRQFVAPA